MVRPTVAASRRVIFALLAGIAASASPHVAQAQTWPDKPVKIVVAFAPGGSIDVFARALAVQLQARLGQPFVVENRPGGGGTMATEQVSRSATDGYTLTVHSSTLGTMAHVQKSNFDASVDLTPIAMIARAPNVVLVPSASPIQSLKDLLDQSKANPGKVLYGSAGVGSTNHLQTELFNKRAGTTLTHVPYKGIAGALQDLAGGRLHVIIGALASSSGLIQSGHLRVVAHAASARPVGAPDVPSIRSFGIDYETSVWWGFFGPPGLPADIRKKLNEATNAALSDPSFVKLMESLGASGAPMTPEQFTNEVKREIAEVKEVVESAKIVFE